MKKIDKQGQERMPFMEAFVNYMNEHNALFDLPGHQGNLKTDLDKLIGHKVFEYDLNSPRGMDNLLAPSGPIKEAQDLFAKACNADCCKFLINGSSCGNIIMFLSVLKPGDKVICPRNIHKSIISALILSGATPVFIMPVIDKSTEIACQPTFESWKKVIDKNKDAKALLIINPTYFGSCCDIKKVTKYAHKFNIIVIVDEAHGSCNYFSNKMPATAMDAKADMATISIHKGGASLTQSSILLFNKERVSEYDVNKAYNMLTTTSPSTHLLASLDSGRKFLVFKGARLVNKAREYAKEAYERINKIPGFRCLGREYFQATGIYDYDKTKVVVEVDGLTINGFEVFRILKDKLHVQPELSETYALLFLFGIGLKHEYVDRMVEALQKISDEYYDPNTTYVDHHYSENFPKIIMSPQQAYQSKMKTIKLEDCEGQVSKEAIMVYPPGIPIIVPGEVFDKNVISAIKYYKESKAPIMCDNPGCDFVNVVDLD